MWKGWEAVGTDISAGGTWGIYSVFWVGQRPDWQVFSPANSPGTTVGPVGALRVQSVWMKGGHSGSASDAPRAPDMGSFPFSPSPQQLPAFITVIKNEL